MSLLPARRRSWGVAVAVAAAACVAGAFVAFTLSFHHFLGRHGGAAGDYGIVYNDELALANAAHSRGLDVADDTMEFLATGN